MPTSLQSRVNRRFRVSRPSCWIADRGEFIDVLQQLRRGQVLLHSDDEDDDRCLVEGHMVYSSWRPLSRFGLLDEVPLDKRDGQIHCYRLNDRGRAFADRACREWRARPLWQRLAVRLTG